MSRQFFSVLVFCFSSCPRMGRGSFSGSENRVRGVRCGHSGSVIPGGVFISFNPPLLEFHFPVANFISRFPNLWPARYDEE